MNMRGLVIEGLTVELVHQPDASQAAALIQVGAGVTTSRIAGPDWRICWSICCSPAAAAGPMRAG
ncbi:MAG: hypothetical protein MUW55_08605 [Pantoea vagans]|nr:hypothetical protein [Pantoea vagans]